MGFVTGWSLSRGQIQALMLGGGSVFTCPLPWTFATLLSLSFLASTISVALPLQSGGGVSAATVVGSQVQPPCWWFLGGFLPFHTCPAVVPPNTSLGTPPPASQEG